MKKQLPPTLTITVTAHDIATGETIACRRCPIARAANRALRQQGFLNNIASVAGSLRVYTRRAQKLVGGYALPSPAHEFMQAFDHGRPVAPFTFTAMRFVVGS